MSISHDECPYYELDEDSPLYELTNNMITVSLRPHQLALLKRCIDLEHGILSMMDYPLLASRFGRISDDVNFNRIETKMGIIGDKAGAGKSYVILSIIAENNEVSSVPKLQPIHNVCTHLRVLTHHVYCRLPLSVLVIPHSIANQWEMYIERFGGGIKHFMVNRQKYMDKVNLDLLRSINLLIVTNTFYNKVASHLSDWQVDRLIFDEADSINTPIRCHVNACFTWFATASYYNLLHPWWSYVSDSDGSHVLRRAGVRSTGHIRDLFARSTSCRRDRDIVRTIIMKNDDGFVDRSMLLPEPVFHNIHSKTPMSIRVLHGMVDPRIIDSLNANDVETAISMISPNNRGTESNIIDLLLEKLDRQLHNYNIRLQMISAQRFDTDQDRVTEEAKVNDKIKELNEKMECIKSRVRTADNCCICYCDLQNRTVTSCCSNVFCFVCINRWLLRSTRCPLCKSLLSVSDLLVVDETGLCNKVEQIEIDVQAWDCSVKYTKEHNMSNIIKGRITEQKDKNERAKILVFSSHDNTFSQIIPELDLIGVNYKSLKGNSFQISSIQDKFRNGELDVLLVNVQNYGSGLNMENTTDIIMMHKIDDATKKQVIGRAQRLGRSTPLNVWTMLYENEIQ